jgi:hypothetical protein
MSTQPNTKINYRQMASGLPIPPFYHPGWLDLLCGPGHWDIVLSRDENGEISGIWPYAIKKKLGKRMLLNPRLTSYLGPLLLRDDQRAETYAQLHSQLPSFAMLEQKLHPSNTEIQPLEDLGFSNLTSPTYVLDLDQPEAAILQGFKGNTRRRVKKCNRTLTLETGEHAVYSKLMHAQLKARLGSQLPAPSTLEGLYDLIDKNQWGKVMTAHDKGQVLAGLAVVKNGDSAVFFSSATNELGRKVGALSFLLWHAMLWAKAQGLRQFDFEGSSVPSIAAFVRNFGGKEHRVYTIRKVNHPLLRAYLSLTGH